MTDAPVTFKTLRPPGPRKFALGAAQNAGVIAALAFWAHRGGPRWPPRAMAGCAAARLAVAIAFNLALWRGGPHQGRADPRHEVTIPEHFLGTFTEPEDIPEFQQFVSRLRAELRLNFADAALALATIGDHNRKLAADASAKSA